MMNKLVFKLGTQIAFDAYVNMGKALTEMMNAKNRKIC